MSGMTVDFNNVRRQAMIACDTLTRQLNEAILKNDQYALPNGTLHGQEMPIKGYVLIDADDIQRTMDDLRSLIGTIGMSYKPGNEDMKDMYSELYPEGTQMQTFNNDER